MGLISWILWRKVHDYFICGAKHRKPINHPQLLVDFCKAMGFEILESKALLRKKIMIGCKGDLKIQVSLIGYALVFML